MQVKEQSQGSGRRRLAGAKDEGQRERVEQEEKERNREGCGVTWEEESKLERLREGRGEVGGDN